MTASEKAKELISYFAIKCAGNSQTNLNHILACQCAAICVDEVIEELEKISGYNCISTTDYGQDCAPSNRIDFFKSVKKELNKL